MNANETGERNQTLYKIAKVDDLDILYREAGSRDAPTILILLGFSTSHMFRNLIMRLSDKFHLALQTTLDLEIALLRRSMLLIILLII